AAAPPGGLGWAGVQVVAAYQSEGDRTPGFEIAEQLGWDPPEYVVVPTGTGTNLFGIWKGFDELHRLGFTARVPRLVAVQPVGADPLVRAHEPGDAIMAPPRAGRPHPPPPPPPRGRR